MSVRRLAENQPDSFQFTSENMTWAKETIAKYPDGRQASAVIPLLWRAQEQEGWVTRPAIEEVGRILDMPFIRVLEVATFYTMFHLAPVGKKAHVQVCGTTPCMLRGAEDLKAVCRRKIHADPHHLSEDGDFSWEEVECLGACVNAPMVQVFSDTYEDLTPKTFEALLDGFASGNPPAPGPQIDRTKSAPEGGLTSLTDLDFSAPKPKAKPKEQKPAAEEATEAAIVEAEKPPEPIPAPTPEPQKEAPKAEPKAEPVPAATASSDGGTQPLTYDAPPAEGSDNLKLISGVGPKLESVLNDLGIFRFQQIAEWTPDHVAWVDARLTFKGRIERDDWMAQAKILAEGGETEFSKRKKKR